MPKFVLITGAGTGIGRSISLTLADQGFSLILCGRNLENLEETKTQLKLSLIHITDFSYVTGMSRMILWVF